MARQTQDFFDPFSIPASWRAVLPNKEVLDEDLGQIQAKLQACWMRDEWIMPKDPYRALRLTPPDKVRVIILGQDPYPGEGHADGLSFSTQAKVLPASLRNIFKEIEADCGTPALNRSGDLVAWAKQGVLLLNTVFTVQKGMAGSHLKLGWQALSSRLIQGMAQSNRPIVWMLWGRQAQACCQQLPTGHCVLRTSHPSPLSAHRGFLGCRHFSKANAFLSQQGLPEIIW